MPLIDFTARDINRGRVVTPAWYRVRIDAITEATSKDGNSTNYNVEGTILHDADTGSTEFADVPTPYWNFNSKAKGFMIPFVQALGADVEPGSRFELRNAEGKSIDLKINNDMYEGRMVNRVNHEYRKPRN